MKIQLLKAWGMNSKGDILPDVATGVAEQLIHRGIAKAVESSPADKQFKSHKVRRK
jgi:hypothetical protein